MVLELLMERVLREIQGVMNVLSLPFFKASYIVPIAASVF